jgi:hypothetical protein
MLFNRPTWIEIVNTSDRTERLRDAKLPGGVLELAPGQRYTIPADVYRRQLRQRWMKRADLVPVPEPVADEQVVESAEEVVEIEAEPSVEMKMADLRELARAKGITFPVGTSKKEALDLLNGVTE